jgi:hypothetical protein
MDNFDAIDAKIAAREAAIAATVAAGARPLSISGGWPSHAVTLVIHRDTYSHRIGQWRLTRIDDEGPFGHTDSESFESAVREAATHWGARLDEAVALEMEAKPSERVTWEERERDANFECGGACVKGER